MVQITIPLDIPDIEVLSSEITEKQDFIFIIKSCHRSTECRQCGRRIDKFHGHDQPIILRHLPILGKAVYLHLTPARYQCLHCEGHPTTTERLDWYHPRSGYTKAYEAHLLLMLVNTTIQDLCRKESLGYKSIEGVLSRHIHSQVNWEVLDAIGVLGIDEIALKKGHQDFAVIVTAKHQETIRLIGVLENRKKETVKRFLATLPQSLRPTIESVCCDMYEGYLNAVKETLGTRIKIVIDRFHVAQKYRGALDHLRKKELKRLKTELDEAEYQQLKGLMWALRKKETELTTKEKTVLKTAFLHSPPLKEAYRFQKKLTRIFEQTPSRSKADRNIKRWMKNVNASQLTCFDPFLTTLENHYHDILNYFDHRHSSGFVEGFNNKIKVIKRRCYGIFNTEKLFQRIHLDLVGFELYG